MNKVVEFILKQMPTLQVKAVEKIKELAASELQTGLAKKTALDEYIIKYLDLAINAYDIPLIPDILVDGNLKKIVAQQIPAITQAIYDTLIDKLD